MHKDINKVFKISKKKYHLLLVSVYIMCDRSTKYVMVILMIREKPYWWREQGVKTEIWLVWPLFYNSNYSTYLQIQLSSLSILRWMDACPVMETDGGRNQRNLLARLVIVYSGAISASDNHTLSSWNIKTPTDTFCTMWDANPCSTFPYQQ